LEVGGEDAGPAREGELLVWWVSTMIGGLLFGREGYVREFEPVAVDVCEEVLD